MDRAELERKIRIWREGQAHWQSLANDPKVLAEYREVYKHDVLMAQKKIDELTEQLNKLPQGEE